MFIESQFLSILNRIESHGHVAKTLCHLKASTVKCSEWLTSGSIAIVKIHSGIHSTCVQSNFNPEGLNGQNRPWRTSTVILMLELPLRLMWVWQVRVSTRLVNCCASLRRFRSCERERLAWPSILLRSSVMVQQVSFHQSADLWYPDEVRVALLVQAAGRHLMCRRKVLISCACSYCLCWAALAEFTMKPHATSICELPLN